MQQDKHRGLVAGVESHRISDAQSTEGGTVLRASTSDEQPWRDSRLEQQERRRKRLPIRVAELMELKKAGFTIEQKTPYQFRVNGVLDIYPIHNRYHDLQTGERGGFRDVRDFVVQFLGD